MSSNGLWKVENGFQSTLTMGHLARFPAGNPPRMPQDEPIDFSQKSDSTSNDTATIQRESATEASFKTVSDAVHQNGLHKNRQSADALSSRGYASLEHLYYVRTATDPLVRKQNGSCEAGVKDGMHPLSIQSESLSRMSDCNPTLAPFHGSFSSHRSDVGRESQKSPDGDVHMSPLSSPNGNTPVVSFVKGKGQKRPSEENGQGMDICNGEELPCPPKLNGHGTCFPNGRLPSKYLDASSEDVGTSSDNVPINSESIARMLNGTNGRSAIELPKLTLPITNPMMVGKTNGFSPGIANSAPCHAAFSPPMEDPSRTGTLVPMPNPWEVLSSSSYKHHGVDDKKSPRAVRPFKAFGNDILNSCNPEILASVGLGGRSNNVSFDKYIKFRSDYMDQMGKNDAKDPTSDVTTADSTRPNGSSSPESVRRANNDSNDSSPSPRIENDESQQQLSDHGRRRGNRFPDHQKDPAYWERRRKNNEAAKRSRDARRRKEDALAMTAKELLEDKMRMAMHLTFQMKEMQKLEEENRFLKEREVTLQNYLFHLESRCRDCTKCSTRNSEKRPVVPNQM